VKRSTKIILISAGAVLALACLCTAVVLGGGAAVWLIRSGSPQAANPPVVQTVEPAVPVVPTQSAIATPLPEQLPTLQSAPHVDQSQMAQAAEETLKTLDETNVHTNNLYDLASRLQGKENIPTTVPAPAVPYQTGDQHKFWVSNVDTNTNFQVDATLRCVTPHLYFWVENGVSYNSSNLNKLCQTFEDKIYPTDREFFGSEWTPGVDNDPHLYILLAHNLGGNLAGYFSSADEYNPAVHPYSNAHEMFMLNADNINLGDSFTYGVLAHEFQHMIHWYRDRNEDAWLNEGFSELASFLNGYDEGGFAFAYLSNPDVQLNDWPNDPNATTPHYGAGFLFLDYFLGRFGEKATQALVADPLNGLASVDDVLSKENAVDPVTQKPIGADNVFADWAVTNFLRDSSIADGKYDYARNPGVPRARASKTISNCPSSAQNGEVHQYGVDYIQITCKGNYTIQFNGEPLVKVVPEAPHTGSYDFWSNKGDESDMTLTHSFDFSNVSGPLNISYWTWYDLEKDYDYVYLEASTDGKNWQILQTPSSTDTNPSGNSYGWGYTGTTQNWIRETVDLSQFDGKQVQLRFEYVTDAEVNGEGFLLDDISIPQINYSTSFENGDGGWKSDGFVRIENALPQTYQLSLILQGSKTAVKTITLDANQSARIPIELGGDYSQAVLVVSGTTRFTRQEAGFNFSITP
jgi:immune inhibitor A